MFIKSHRQVAEFKSIIEASAENVFRWHWQPGTLDRLIPPWESVEVLHAAASCADGETATLRVGLGPLKLNWVARHCEAEKNRQFSDVQQSGPFAYWHHRHKLEPIDGNHCTLIDRVEYELPAAAVSDLALGEFVRTKLKRMFRYRHELTAADVKIYNELGGRIMRVLVTGAHGLVGSHLLPFLTSQGHQVVRLVRSNKQEGDIVWHPSKGEMDRSRLEGFDAVVHLAGDNIASGRWTETKKAEIRKSRIEGTKLLCESLAMLDKPPAVLVSASAIGYYGNRNDEVLTEESSPGAGFLAEVCKDWEAATMAAQQKGIRVAMLRTGVVLSSKGGALTKMLPPFQLGAGGRLGSGKQHMSWISLEDLVGAIYHVLTHAELKGPINAVAPNPVTNNEFTVALGSALKRPTFFPVPGFAAHLLLGEMADELLLSSALVKPDKLIASGYAYRQPELEPMLKQLLGAA